MCAGCLDFSPLLPKVVQPQLQALLAPVPRKLVWNLLLKPDIGTRILVLQS